MFINCTKWQLTTAVHIRVRTQLWTTKAGTDIYDARPVSDVGAQTPPPIMMMTSSISLIREKTLYFCKWLVTGIANFPMKLLNKAVQRLHINLLYS